ncbi:uncharacterized protein LOC62_01G000765 [Vanrija pseudolonga]|uniref:Uncharacterized protein n=1 Tax=Vanrija pseudolonga TaxID=143232 RepID=A0AAF0XZQ0_9TREE|nr:hypothetical protein LOC62_01G000765 [Vanrija pseudolonga]
MFRKLVAMDGPTVAKLSKIQQQHLRWERTPLAAKDVGQFFGSLQLYHTTQEGADHVAANQLVETLGIARMSNLFFRHLASEEVAGTERERSLWMTQ